MAGAFSIHIRLPAAGSGEKTNFDHLIFGSSAWYSELTLALKNVIEDEYASLCNGLEMKSESELKETLKHFKFHLIWYGKESIASDFF